MERKMIDITALGQASDGFYLINDESVYVIKNDCKIKIKDGIKAYIIDNTENSSVYVFVGNDASLDYTILNSKSSKREFDVNGELIVNEILLDESNESFTCNLLRENSTVNKKLLAFADNSKQDVVERINHQVSKTYSDISNIGISMNKANINFDITGFIKKGMSKSNCRQLSKGVVMDNESSVTAKPILLIDEYDCFASHGASIGKMSDEDLFYLMSRGLTKNEAFFLILGGIVKPFIDRLPIEELKDVTLKKINNMIEK